MDCFEETGSRQLQELVARVAGALRSHTSSSACLWTTDEANEVSTVAGDIGRLAISALHPELEELEALRLARSHEAPHLIEAARAVLDLAEAFEQSYEELEDLADAVARADRAPGW